MNDKSKAGVKIEKVPTRFVEEAAGPAPISRGAALGRAESAVAKLAKKSDQWLKRDFEALNLAVQDLIAADAAAQDAQIDVAYQHASALRDISGMFEKQALSVVADSFCELLSRMRHAGRTHRSALATHMDALKLAYRDGFDGSNSAEVNRLAEHLASLIDIFPDPDAILRQDQARKRAAYEKKKKAAAAG
ncbi:MAG: hypothetical protein ACMVY4_16040 [Minwuia sp.]|uniref:hypothetical protein n=1 Tax=Minwuia sp. TaxID=2493630 RepID=UPI003A875D8A